MRKTILLSFAVIIGLALHSCAPEPVYSRQPEYHGKTLFFTDADPQSLTLNTQNDVKRLSACNAGDEVTVFLPVYKPGEYIYKTTYKWSYALKSNPNKKLGGRDIVDDRDPCSKSVPPMWTFNAPSEPGEYYVFFRAVYSYYGKAPDGSDAIYGSYPTTSGPHGYEDKSSVYGVLVVK